ncbi:MAG TPA: hypothetical protein VJ873_09980 [bacterium]|nr:hypothetical protein [bacterium]
MDFKAFEIWFGKLSETDRDYLGKHPAWSKEYQKAKASWSLPKDFAEKTMEILEGGSESET